MSADVSFMQFRRRLVGMSVDHVKRQVIVWRRHLHAHPELSFREHETARFIKTTLGTFGHLEIESPTPTSVVARLKTGRHGPTLALRADIDALPIQEESDVEFASQSNGIMHACGHDGHAAILLAVARELVGRRAELTGEIRFLFQHAEELPPGGASELVAVGALEGVDGVLGAHLISTLEVGKVAVLDGACTAAADTFSVRVEGRGGHAGFPHKTIDPVAVSAQAISNLQHIVARTTSPLDRVVVSVTRVAAGSADNIIPETSEFGGTVRTYRREVRDQTRDALARILNGVTAAHGATYELDYVEGYAPVVNDPGLAEAVREAAGPERAAAFEPLMAGEDFSAYLAVAPGCFFFVGAGHENAFPHHHPRFTIDERALSVGIETFTGAALRLLGTGATYSSAIG
jgi:amidohydrolase